MLSKLCDTICAGLIQKGIIPADQKGLYYYGLHQGILSVSSIITTLIISILMGMFWHGIFYYIAYIPIRSNAGGFHAKTPLRCYLCSVILVVLALLIIKIMDISIMCCLSLTIIAVLIIFILAPIEDKNKPLTDAEYRCFRKRTRMLLIGEVLLIAVCCSLNAVILAKCIMLSLLTLSIMLLLGKAKNHMLNKQVDNESVI